MDQRNTDVYLKHHIISTLIQNMLTQRLDEMARTGASPIDHGAVYDRQFLVARTRDALTLAAMVKEGRSQEALDSLIVHATRVVQHGFTKGELERARRNVIAVYRDLQAEESNRTSREYADEYMDHYVNGGYIPGVAAESKMLIEGTEKVTLDEVNAYLRSIIGKDNVSVLISGPQTLTGASHYPTSRDVIAHFNRIINAPQSPYLDLSANDRLLAQEPKAGGIVNHQYRCGDVDAGEFIAIGKGSITNYPHRRGDGDVSELVEEIECISADVGHTFLDDQLGSLIVVFFPWARAAIIL